MNVVILLPHPLFSVKVFCCNTLSTSNIVSEIKVYVHRLVTSQISTFKSFCLHSQFMSSRTFPDAFIRPLLCMIHDYEKRMIPAWLSCVEATSASGPWQNRNRAMDISYYRLMFLCQTYNTSMHVHSKIFQWTGGKRISEIDVCVRGWEWDFVHLLDLLPSSGVLSACIDSFSDSGASIFFFFAGIFSCSLIF